MNGTVVVENNTEIKMFFDGIFGIDTRRKHFSINNKYAIGIVRDYREIFIFDYERSSRPLAKVKNGGQATILRLGFDVNDTLGVLESLHRVMLAVMAPKSLDDVASIPKVTPQPIRETIPVDDIRNTVGINKDGKIVMQNNTQYKKRV